MDFFDKHYNTPAHVVTRADATFAAAPGGLKGKRIGVQRTTIHDRYATATFKGGKGFALRGAAFNGPAFFGIGAGIAVRKGDQALQARLNAALAAMRADGTYKEINDKYFDFDVYGAELKK